MRRDYQNSRNNNHSNNRVQKQMHYSPNLLDTLENAIENKFVATVEYDSREKGISQRRIEPMAILYKGGKRNLVGWCRLREDWRSFRLDRINLVIVDLKEPFTPRANFNVADFEDNEQPTEGDARDYDVRPVDKDDMEDLPKKTFAKTMSENKLNFNTEGLVTYSESEEDLSM